MMFLHKVVLVTGASSGIGASTATEFAEQGAHVVIVGRNKGKLENVKEKCDKVGRPSLMLLADVTNDEDVKEIVNQTLAAYGRLDILVNNAGVVSFGSILSDDAIEAFDQVIAVNLRAAVCLTHFAAPHLVKSGGNIINISSTGSVGVLSPLNFSYNTSKAGLDHFTRSVALELASKGVRVNCINPGPVRTDCLNTITTVKEEQDKLLDNLTNSTALGKICESNEVADLILYLASDKAKSITGCSFFIDNGLLLKGTLMMN